MEKHVFTIGHSTHPADEFVRLVSAHGVTAVADVRSHPYSRWNPQFNRETLKETLAEHGIVYVFLGTELGARSDDPACYVDGKLQYDLLAQTPLFQRGLERVYEGAQHFKIALMCAEKEPLECHRTILVSRHLVKLGFSVDHIHADGSLENHADAMERLREQLSLSSHDLFRSHSDIIEEAYRIQGERIAYVREEPV